MNWIEIKNETPPKGVAVWLYNATHKHITLGTYGFIDDGEDNSGYAYLVMDGGGIYVDKNNVIEVETMWDDDYEFTHWHPVPTLPV
jgi:hypothetical protein